MRTRSGSTEPEGFRRNSLPGHNTLLAGGRWFNGKFMKLFRTPRAQDTVNVTTDGRRSPSNKDEEEESPQTVSPSVIITFGQCLEDKLFFEASQQLREREELLFSELMEAEGLRRHEEDVNSLAADYAVLKRLILQTLLQSLSLSTGTVSANALTSAVKAVHQEDRQDQLWKQRDQTPPGWRPSGWKQLHDETLRSLVKDRMDNPSTPTDLVGKSSIMADICSMGKQLLDDLRQVVAVVKTCYPPQANICDFYVKLYHQAFSARLRKIAYFVLEDEDCTYLLRWVNEYYPERVQKLVVDCDIDWKALGNLLPQELLESLEEQYLSHRQSELMTYVSRALEEEKQKWNNGEEPAREDGCYVNHVAYDIIQFIYGMVTSAGKVVGDVHKAQTITRKLNPLMQSFKVFQDEVMKRNRPNSRAIVKANLVSIRQFSDVLEKNGHLFVDDVRRNCSNLLTEMKESAHAYLLSPVHDSLKSLYRKLGTSEWLNKGLFEKLLLRIQAEGKQLDGLKESCHQELVCRFHQDVTVEYVTRLLRGDKLKDRERQNAAYATVKNNAESLHMVFVQMGSNQDWLKEILTKIAEVLKLQELPAIQMQVASLGSAFPDLREKHVSALLKLKTNISRAERKIVKETLSDTLRETGVTASQLFFSKVQVK